MSKFRYKPIKAQESWQMPTLQPSKTQKMWWEPLIRSYENDEDKPLLERTSWDAFLSDFEKITNDNDGR